MIEINAATADRIFDISRALKKFWRESYKELINEEYLASLTDGHWVKFLESGLENKTVSCLVAEADGFIVGVTIFGRSISEQFPDDGEIISLYVALNFIGRGIGHSLFEGAWQSLGALGFSNVIVCVFSGNGRAIKFYEAHGFGIVAEDERINMGAQELRYVIMRRKING